MSDAVSWVLMAKIKEGKLDDFKALMDEMVSSTMEEPGAIMYEFFISDDNSLVHIYERYADSETTLAHMASFGGNFAKRFFECADPAGWNVYGSPNEAASRALAGGGARLFGPLGGFAR